MAHVARWLADCLDLIDWGRGDFQNFAMMAPSSLGRLAIDIQNTNVHCKGYSRICPRKYRPGL